MMGSFFSRQGGRVEELHEDSSFSYIYPPNSGSYFANHFFMGGKKFDTAQPEGYLFGDNADLNYLGPKPHNVNYQMPPDNQPVKALKCLVNIRKDSLRLVRAPNPPGKPEDDEVITNTDDEQNRPAAKPLYNLEFTFDADCPCSITVYYNAVEEMNNRAVRFSTSTNEDKSDTVHYNAGCNQQFCIPTHVIDPSLLHEEEAKQWNPKHIPIAIQVCAECGPDFAGHSHITYAAFDKLSDGGWSVKATKQKQAINGVCYLFQEIYGIENKHRTNREVSGDVAVPDDDNDDDDEDDNSECVVCLSDMRDTLILPCKHLCLCSSCANQLRFQQSGCPICRQPFRALLQIRAVRKKSALSGNSDRQTIPEENEVPNADDEDETESNSTRQDSVPPGYEVIPLISAINGPVTSASFAASLSSEGGATRTGSLRSISSSTSSSIRRSKRKNKSKLAMEVETEMTSGDGDGFHGNERRRTRSRRKKKQLEDSEQINVEVQKEEEVKESPQLHVYVNQNALNEISTTEDDNTKGDGDHSKTSELSKDETTAVEPSSGDHIETPQESKDGKSAIETNAVDFQISESAGNSNEQQPEKKSGVSSEKEMEELITYFSSCDNPSNEEKV